VPAGAADQDSRCAATHRTPRPLGSREQSWGCGSMCCGWQRPAVGWRTRCQVGPTSPNASPQCDLCHRLLSPAGLQWTKGTGRRGSRGVGLTWARGGIAAPGSSRNRHRCEHCASGRSVGVAARVRGQLAVVADPFVRPVARAASQAASPAPELRRGRGCQK
jgi:hypothetical protein